MNTPFRSLCSALMLGTLFCHAGMINPKLVKPECTAVLKTPDSCAAQLKLLLDENKRGEFYEKADQMLEQISGNEAQIISDEQQQDVMWTIYLIANTPLLRVETFQDTEIEMARLGEDIDVKSRLIVMLQHPSYDKYFPEGGKYHDMRAVYASTVIKELRDAYAASPLADADVAKTTQSIQDECLKAYMDRMEQIDKEATLVEPPLISDEELKFARDNPDDQEAAAKVTNNKRAIKEWEEQIRKAQFNADVERVQHTNVALSQFARQRKYPRVLKRIEKTYVDMLVRFYPGKAAQVKKHMKQAGYTDKEIPDLIDRTVGRTERTEFLYKGSSRKRGL